MTEPAGPDEVEVWRPEPGDPLLKRLVELAQLGWDPNLIVFSNGRWLQGRLVSARAYRAALASSIRVGANGGAAEPFAALDSLVAAAIEDDDPGPSGLGPTDPPEPRFIHLAGVRDGVSGEEVVPFLRLRLPAVSGFWLTAGDDEEG